MSEVKYEEEDKDLQRALLESIRCLERPRNNTIDNYLYRSEPIETQPRPTPPIKPPGSENVPEVPPRPGMKLKTTLRGGWVCREWV